MATRDESSAPAARRSGRSRSGNRDTSIRSRLTWAMLIPWVVVGLLWALGCSLFAFDAIYTQQVGSGVRQLSLPAVSSLDSMQRERQLSVQYATEPGTDTAELNTQQARTDATVARMTRETQAIADSAPDELREPLEELQREFERLPDVRSGLASGDLSINDINEYYNGLFDTANRLFDTQARIVPDANTLQGATAAASLFRASDLASREAATVNMALNSDDLSPQQYRQLITYINTYHAELDNAAENMRPDVRQRFEELRANPAWKRTIDAENAIVENGFSTADEMPIDAQEWEADSTEVANGLSDMVRVQADQVSNQAVDQGRAAVRTVLFGSLGALALAIVSFFVARRVYRAVIDEALLTRLQDLRTESLELAQRLPDLIRRIRDGQQIDPHAEMTRLRQYGNDEVGQLANAIQVFHEEAVTSAVRETKARRGARAVFVGMAYRVQQLLRNMHRTIDDLEKHEENSAQLGRLYELDNSTTRARRKVENLLVLGDQQPGRRWSRPVALLDVLRASVAEIDQYARVTLGHVPDVSLTGGAVGDTIHLVSELVDNATAFSPPETEVHVNASLVARGVAVEISDQGLGMDESSRNWANDMMCSTPRFDQLVLNNNRAEQLGLFTAARLADRRSVSVEFGVSQYGGTRATVLLGQHMLESRDSDDVPTASIALPTSGTRVTRDIAIESAQSTENAQSAENAERTENAETTERLDVKSTVAPVDWPEPNYEAWPVDEPDEIESSGTDVGSADEQVANVEHGHTGSASFSTTGKLPVVPENAADDGARRDRIEHDGKQDEDSTANGMSGAAVSATENGNGTATAGTAGNGSDSAVAGDRPALPRRVPQSHLVDGLRAEPEEGQDNAVASPSRLASFGRAFRSGVNSNESSRNQNNSDKDEWA